MILMHFFIGGSDWYVAEYSPEERLFFTAPSSMLDVRPIEFAIHLGIP